VLLALRRSFSLSACGDLTLTKDLRGLRPTKVGTTSKVWRYDHESIACTLSSRGKNPTDPQDVGSLTIFFVMPLLLIVMLGGANLQLTSKTTTVC